MIGLPFVGIMILSVLDSIFTLNLVRMGFTEVNPIMQMCLSAGVQQFLLVKYGLTAVGVTVLYQIRDTLIFGNRISVQKVSLMLMYLYLVLIIYQLILFAFVVK